ncbi:uncharacterized protein LOC115808975 [Chanos chanos]|uniref:Uncharacterized protein LOC115808975 n=1 Tax=Chanos chanos TaxID=29144 RepID=A0A6J2UZZ0_CHACN|nr:uncharacterized protein LOC115808975 [Chanos chanos]
MSQRKKRPMVFSWQKSFAVLNPWRKGKGDMMLENEVVLTKMKLFHNFSDRLLNIDDSVSTISMTMSEQDASEPVQAEVISVHSAPPEQVTVPKTDYLSTIFSDSQLPRLYKFESEDSGVELPSGANSPSTPTGSEQSFVVHSRESSCDSGNPNSDTPASDPLLLLEKCPDTIETEQTCTGARESDDLELENRTEAEERAYIHLADITEVSEGAEDGTLRNTTEDCEGGLECPDSGLTTAQTAETADESKQSSPDSIEAYDGNTGAEFQQQPLRKSTTSDSLDEYMEECCRLSEVNQARSNPLGSGLGYLEHICQLIEKIGQLQEHNLKLQKQICNLQRDSRMTKTKEDFFVQHCGCGAASLAFQELKHHSRSEFHNLTASNGTLSDLTTIPEVARLSLRPARRDGDGVYQPAVPLWRRGLNRRSYTEGEARYLSDRAEVLSAPHRRLSENYTWGRVKELVRKTRLRNQSRLGLCSSSLKRSCPQLYRPDVVAAEASRRDRNSMIALGHQKLDYL